MAGVSAIRIGLGVMLATLVTACNAMPVDDSYLPTGSITRPPSGYVSFCHRLPGECQFPAEGADRVALTFERWEELSAVNDEFNLAIRPATDDALFGRVEFWTYPDTGAGDCEDYALAKRRALIERGWPPRALRFGVAVSPATGRHAVLVVRTDKGDFVLDNLTPFIVSWRASRYEWVSLQSGADPLMWLSAGRGVNSASSLATASSGHRFRR